MVEVMQLIFQTLRIEHLAGRFPDPTNQFLFLVFFPSILVLIVIYLFAGKIFHEHKGIKMLLSVAMYIFVIVYPPNSEKSLYSAIAPLGEFWFLIVIVLGVLWFVLYGWWGRKGESRAGGSMPSIGGAMGTILSKKKAWEEVEAQISLMKGTLKMMRTADSGKLGDYIREFRAAYVIADDALNKLELGGVVDISGKKREIDKLLAEFEKLGAREK